MPSKNAGRISSMFVFGLFSLCILSCKKPVDDIPPQITVNNPQDGATYTALDTVVVSIDVSDNEMVNSVRTELITIDGQLMAPGLQTGVCASDRSLTFGYPLDNIHLETGNYYLRITAEDGIQNKTAFIEVHVNELPLERTHVYWINDIDGSASLMRRQDMNEYEDPEICTPITTGATRLYGDRWNQRMVLTDPHGTHLQFVDLKDCVVLNESNITVDLPGSHAGFFDIQDRLFYSAASGDQVRVFRTNGVQINGLPFPEDIEVSALGALEDDIALAGTFNGNHFVFFINKNSGALQHTVTFDHPVSALIAVPETNKVFVYLDEDGTTTLKRIDGTEGTTNFDFDIPNAGNIVNVFWRGLPPNGDLIVTHEDGNIFSHNPNQNGDPGDVLFTGAIPMFGVADWTDGHLYFSSGGALFDYPSSTSGVGIGLVYNGEEPWIEIMYNK